MTWSGTLGLANNSRGLALGAGWRERTRTGLGSTGVSSAAEGSGFTVSFPGVTFRAVLPF